MTKKESVTGYCPKQDMNVAITVTYNITSTLQADFITPCTYYCKYSNTIEACSDCPIFNNLT